MSKDKYNLAGKSEAELHEWVVQNKPGTNEYIAGVRESMRRVAALEELIEKEETPAIHREKIAMGIAIISIAAFITFIVLTY